MTRGESDASDVLSDRDTECEVECTFESICDPDEDENRSSEGTKGCCGSSSRDVKELSGVK